MRVQMQINRQRIVVRNTVIAAHSKYLMEVPKLHKMIPAKKPCVTDVQK